MRARISGVLLLAVLTTTSVRAQAIDFSFLKTRAEETDFRETSRYEEVVAFTEVVANASDDLHQTTFGYSHEGRPLPLVVFGDVRSALPADVRASGKTRVFIQANIHAGEVCGKEAALMLLRSLAAGQHGRWMDSLVVLVAPIYNADGNERITLTNRPLQNGPIGGMGQRPNAQGYDLNRDHMKLDAPATRSIVHLLSEYDPDVVVDLHTTNGTYHGYHLTYAPPLHPDTPPAIDRMLRDTLLPAVTDSIRAKYGWDFYYYGNVPREGGDVERGWYTFDHRPRFGTNYAGLRQRFGILSEAYSYASFEERVLASFYFVEEVLGFAYRHASELRSITERADGTSVVGDTLTLRARHARSEKPVEILMGEVTPVRNLYSGALMLQREDVQHPESMYAYQRFAPVETAVAPEAYLVPDSLQQVLDRLTVHGVRYDVLQADTTLAVERFRIDSLQVSERVYQGHQQQTAFGSYETVTVDVPAGTARVPVGQPLGRLVFELLEPRADDGLVNWNVISLEEAIRYPIVRLRPTGSKPD